LPLNQKVTFQTVLEKGNRIQVPKMIRWQFKVEPTQVLKVGVNAIDLGRGCQFFYSKMAKDGRIHISRLTILILQGEKTSLAGYLLEITLEPTWNML
jgi:hypothetical protein